VANLAQSQSNRLLALLPAEDRRLIDKLLKDYSSKAGEVLQEPGEPLAYVYFPHTGMVSLLTVMKNGQAIETATIGNEGAIGAEAGAGTTKAITRAVVQIDFSASRMGRTEFLKCVERRPVIRMLAHRATEALIGQMQQTAACNALHSIDTRLARWLLQSQDRSANGNPITLTQEFLSEMLAVRRTSVTEFAKALQDQGLIKYRRGSIEILNRAGLEKKACECYGAVAKQTREITARPLK
jgi:CRP-like cAMP-binding protein